MKSGKPKATKVYQALSFARGPMVCPSCQTIFDRATESCPACQFNGEMAVRKFPFPAPPLEPVIDPSGKLTQPENKAVVARIEKLTKRYPQLRVFACIVPLGDGVNLREFGFWMLNKSEFSEGEEAKSFAILFLIDPKGMAISVTTGYGLEPMVSDSDWSAICLACQDYFYRQKYSEGIQAFLDETKTLLANRKTEIDTEILKK